MAPGTSSRGGFLLTGLQLSLGMAIILTNSECTTSNASRTGAAITGAAVAGSAGAAATPGKDGFVNADREVWMAPPVTPAVIAVPTGALVTAHFRGLGVQIYVCTAASGNHPPPTPIAAAGTAGTAGTAAPTFSWTLKAPEARLLDALGAEVGAHGTGPSWTSSLDGSAVGGTKVAQADAPVATAIPWLLLRGTTHSGTGVFTPVTFVQRVGTVGGKAPPASTCDEPSAGAEIRIDYSADYYFFAGGT
jgi:Protein of unknown function (DUF3455)